MVPTGRPRFIKNRRQSRAHPCPYTFARSLPWLAAALVCGCVGIAHAEEGDQTPGLVSNLTLPAKARGTPPPWAGKAFCQGVVAVAKPYAVDAPRVSVTAPSAFISIENGFPASTLSGLTGLGYMLGITSDIGSVQAVLADPKTGKQYGAADARREGTVIGLPRSQGR